MSADPPTFRDFGILPEDLPPPPEKVRCFLSPGRIVGQYIGSGIVSALGLGLTVLFALTLPAPLNLLGGAAALVGFGAFVFLATHNDYRWVELEGNTLRAKHLYTGRTIERSVDEIESLGTMIYPLRQPETVVIEKMLGRVKGVEIRFRDGRTPLRIMRSDPAMTNARELIEAVLYRMSQIREIDAEVVTFAGQPLVRNIHWKGEQPAIPTGKGLKVSLCCLILLALMFGAIAGYWGQQQQKRREIGSVPPHEIALHSLIQNGPGTNRHITLTDFYPGGYAIESQSGSSSWTQIWIALFPTAEEDEGKEIKVVLSSKSVKDEAALRQLLKGGRVTGICSETPRSSWGTDLGPKLVQANQGRPLSSAWDIEEMSEPPSASLVTGLLTGSGVCFAVVLLFAVIVFWKAA